MRRLSPSATRFGPCWHGAAALQPFSAGESTPPPWPPTAPSMSASTPSRSFWIVAVSSPCSSCQNRLSQDDRLRSLGLWRPHRVVAGGAAVGHKALGAKRWIKIAPCSFSHPSGSSWFDSDDGPLLQTWAGAPSPGRTFSRPFRACRRSMLLVLKQARLGNHPHLCAHPDCGILSGRHQPAPGADPGNLRPALVAGVWTSGQNAQALPEARAHQFCEPRQDQGSGYQTKQSLIAIGSGGVWGKGRPKAPRPRGDFLPYSHADFIFGRILARRHGFVGALFVLQLYFSY